VLENNVIFNLKISLAAILMMLLLSAPVSAGWDPNEEQKARDTVVAFKKNDSGMDAYFSKARGYIVYPSVGKAGFGIGGAYGSGVVFEADKVIGTSSLTQVSFGFQLGGQVYSEIVFFKDSAAMDHFKKGEIELSAQVSAVAVTEGVSAKTDFKDGIAIFTMAKGGLMYEATVAGQKLSFKK
jgi:lipid-binding SYLF domain-containing protein